MKGSEIKVGGLYKAKVSNKIVTVKVYKISTYIDSSDKTCYRYYVTNLSTGRKTTFRSAAKFRCKAEGSYISDEDVKALAEDVKGRIELSGGTTQEPTNCPTVQMQSSEKETPSSPATEGEHSSDPTSSGQVESNSAVTTQDVPTASEAESMTQKTQLTGIRSVPDFDWGDTKCKSSTPAPTTSTPPHLSPAAAVVTDAAPTKSSLPRLLENDLPGSAQIPSMMGVGLASQLSAGQASMVGLSKAPHIIVLARAGTGKTTTAIEGIKDWKGYGTSITPSPQQRVVWEALKQTPKAASICMVAFNKSIATELQSRVPQGVVAMTMHSLGYKAVQGALKRQAPENSIVEEYTSEVMGMDLYYARKNKGEVISAVSNLVSKCKVNLTDPTLENLDDLVDYYDIGLNGSRQEIYDLVPKVLEKCRNPRGKITFDDMIWLPIVLNLPVTKFDVLIVDEAQDLNRCQQALAKRAGSRLVFIGDDKQAIYGFAGADCESISRLTEELKSTDRGCEVLPLTVTRRCGKAIVEEARQIVPDFSAHESNPEGAITSGKYPSQDGKKLEWEHTYCNSVKPGDFIICRVNAPLVSQCFMFIKRGIKATIQGRDIGSGLISTIKKVCGGEKKFNPQTPVTDLITNLSDWLADQEKKERSKRNPNDNRLIALQDRFDCLVCFAEGSDAKVAQDVIGKIEAVFTDDKNAPGVRLSSIHKAKGLESQRVFFLMPKGGECPHPMARTPWQIDQELNLKYVGITRAISELCYVR